jgi:exodeoxyribonuclease-3
VRIATWNVNSLRARIDRVEALLQRHDIDVLAPKETKAREDQLPLVSRVWSVYVPNGRKPDDPHYLYKLDWLATLRAEARQWLGEDTALVGDWNVAPRDEDVFDVALFKNSTHVTPRERAAFQAFLDDGWADVVRPHAAGPAVYTYWDYYRQRYERNRGLRIDFVLGSPSLTQRVTHAFIDREERAGQGASDHAPVIVDLGPAAG